MRPAANWRVGDIQFKSWKVMHMQLDPRDRRLHAAVSHAVYGPTTHYSDDLGQTWMQARQVPALTRPSKSGRPPGTPDEAEHSAEGGDLGARPEKMIKVWNIKPGRILEPGVLYAGAEPASLFVSRDRGETWDLNEPLFDHPHRGTWFPGNGGLCLHTILLDPDDPARMYIAVSTGGCYRSDDGGQTWTPRNRNVRADFRPDKYPEYGQCVHKMTLHPSNPQVLFQQNHCGIYRSDNMGEDWIDIGEGRLPSRFGFPIAVHPIDPRIIYVVLEESDEYRMSVDGRFAVWRSPDSGDSWQRMTQRPPRAGASRGPARSHGHRYLRRCGHLCWHEHRSVVLQPRFGRELGIDGRLPASHPIGGGSGYRGMNKGSRHIPCAGSPCLWLSGGCGLKPLIQPGEAAVLEEHIVLQCLPILI